MTYIIIGVVCFALGCYAGYRYWEWVHRRLFGKP